METGILKMYKCCSRFLKEEKGGRLRFLHTLAHDTEVQCVYAKNHVVTLKSSNSKMPITAAVFQGFKLFHV